MKTKSKNDLLCRQREMRGWSCARVAEELNKVGGSTDSKQVGKWERGVARPSPFYRERLCSIYNVTADQLGFVEPLTVAETTHSHWSKQVTYYDANSPVLGNDDMYIKRRKLLRLFSVAGSALILPIHLEVDWERVSNVLANPTHMDMTALQDFAAINRHYWHIFRASSQKRAILDGVLGQLDTLIQFLSNTCSAQHHQQLCILVSDLSQLAGEIFFDANQYDAAQSCYTFAANAAKEAKHYDLWGCALIRHAFLPIYDGQFHEALPLLQGAEKLAHRGDTILVTKYWVAAVLADTQAGLGNATLCQRSLDRAEEVQHIKNGDNGAWLRFDGTRLPEQRGACFVHLDQPNLAVPALQKALLHLSTPTRRRGLVLIDLAMASLQQRDIDLACDYASEAASIAVRGGSGVVTKGLHTLRKQLEPFAEASKVKALDRHLQLLS